MGQRSLMAAPSVVVDLIRTDGRDQLFPVHDVRAQGETMIRTVA